MRKVFERFAVQRHLLRLVLGVVFLASMSMSAFAQEATPEVVGMSSQTPGVNIIYPLRSTEVWGMVPIIGTADIPNMTYFYLEYLPLNDDLSSPEGAPWLPATPASSDPVDTGALAVLDTTKVSDGVYALRLVVNDSSGGRYTDTVEPIRVSNDRYNNVIRRLVRDALIINGIQPVEPTPVAPPTTAPESNAPTVTPLPGNSAVNIRRCDVIDNYRCPIVGYLYIGQSAEIIGISNNGSGWYEVRLPSGLEGWVSPTVVSVQGDMSGVPSVAPPTPLPPPPAPSAANITLNGISTDSAPTCGVVFNVDVNVANTGDAASESGTVTLQDVNLSTGEVTFTGYGTYPAIDPGGNYVVRIPAVTTVYYNQAHELRAYAGSSTVTTQYTLAQGSCGVAPTPPPSPRTVQVNESQNGQSVTLNVGDVLLITLDAELSAGYSWFLAPDPLTAVMLTSGPITVANSNQPGQPERQQFSFQAIASGQDLVRLSYQQGREAPQDSYQITVIVS